ncbi:MAG: hypothetical protein WA880_06845, partial [Ornithinimicrobium sp.]
LLAATVGMVPIEGSSAEVAGLSLTAERMAGRRRRVATVLVSRSTPQDVPEDDADPDASDERHPSSDGTDDTEHRRRRTRSRSTS